MIIKIIQKIIGVIVLIIFVVTLGWWLIPGFLLIASFARLMIWGLEGIFGKDW